MDKIANQALVEQLAMDAMRAVDQLERNAKSFKQNSDYCLYVGSKELTAIRAYAGPSRHSYLGDGKEFFVGCKLFGVRVETHFNIALQFSY